MKTIEVIRKLQPGQIATCGYYEIIRPVQIKDTIFAKEATQHLKIQFLLIGGILDTIPLEVFDFTDWQISDASDA